MVVLKAKRTRRLRFRAGERVQKGPTMSDEPKRTYLGTVDVSEPNEIFSIPDINASPEKIVAAIEAANLARAEASAEASRKLRTQFLGEDKADG
jgi:hypothetical protein